MNNNWQGLIRVLRGPILLITLGVLFLVGQTTMHSIWRTWPVFLIMYGVLKLLERITARETNEFSSQQGGSI
ncbi:MAG: DUF5668 domain-containing protein [Bryobacteraceae bacterium]